MKKRILLLTVFILSVVGNAFSLSAFSADKVSVSDFKYTNELNAEINTLSANGTVNVDFDIVSNADEVDFTAVMLFYNNGKLKKTEKKEDSADNTTKHVHLTMDLPSELVNPSIAVFIFDNLKDLNVLTSPSYFNSDENGACDISINGTSLNIENDLYSYEKILNDAVDTIPYKCCVIPRDLGAKFEISYVGEKIFVDLKSHSGIPGTQYQISVPVLKSFIAIEAEDGIISGSNAVIASDGNASGGKIVQFTNATALSAPPPDSTVTFNIDVPGDVTYNIFLRYRHGYRGAAVFSKINGGSWLYTNDDFGSGFEDGYYFWVKVPKGPYKFTKGTNTLIVGDRNPVYFDKVILTTSDTFVPSGKDGNN